MLDEPTNHLDLEACLWLENYLLTYPETLVIVSHDRHFLNNVITDVMHVANKKLQIYKGDYDTFVRTRADRMKQQKRAFEAGEKKRAHVQAFIDKFRFNAKRASIVQSRIKMLNKMEMLDDVIEDPSWKISFPDVEDIGTPVLQISSVSFGYPGSKKTLFKKVNFGVDLTSRICILGPNGAGKS